MSGLSNDELTFDDAGDGPALYNIIHYQRVWLNFVERVDSDLIDHVCAKSDHILFIPYSPE